MPGVRLSDYLDRDLVFGPRDIDVMDKDGLLRFFSERTAAKNKGLNHKEVFDLLMQREREHTTAVGDGVAIPHALVKALSGPVIAAAVLAGPIDYGAADGKGVDVAFLVLCPEDRQALHLRMLAKLARLLVHRGMAVRMRAASGRDELWELIRSEDERNV